jgi:DNA segregation ATPase FtsK/SpoIIIE, S-DNA-T family
MARSARRQKSDRPGGLAPLHPLFRLAGAVALTAAAAFLVLSLATFHPADSPTHLVHPPNEPAQNLCGPVGAWVAYHIVRMFGAGSWVLAAAATLYAFLVLIGRSVSYPALRMVGILMIGAALGGIQAIVWPSSGSFPGLAGGVIGQGAAVELALRFGAFAAIWLLLLGLVGGIVAFDRWMYIVPGWVIGITAPVARRAGSVAGATASSAARAGGELVAGLTRDKEALPVRLTDLGDELAVKGRRRARSKVEQELEEIEESEAEPEPSAEEPEVAEVPLRKRRARRAAPASEQVDDADEVEQEAESSEKALAAAADVEEAAEDDDDDLPGAPQVFDADALREKIAKLPVAFGHQTRKIATEEDLRDLQGVADLPGYKFPGLDLLEEPESNFSERLESYVREQAEALEAALQQYRIDGEVVGIESGPVITLFHVRLAPGTKVAQLSAISSDVARSLKAINIRIVPNMVGRDTVAVEVPNAAKEKVRLKELMSKSETFARMKLPMFLGKDASGEPLIADLTQMPHMLIAGTTGSGKSVCMNTIIMSFLYTKKPSELKLVLVDPKMVEMSQFRDIPHLMCPVVTEMAKAAAILEWAMRKMDERYELLAEAGCRDIAAYNDLPWEELRERFNPQTPEEEARIPRRLPYMVFIIDELADLMMTTKEVEGSIIRLAQKARAVGIHLILATQRPQANVVTGLIKSNMPARIAFKVASGMDSRIVLDQKGGELLLGQGDMLYLSPRTSKLIRAQGTLVDDPEIRRVVRFMRDVAKPSFEHQLLQLRKSDSDEERILESKNNSSASLAAAQEDPMFFRAVEIVLETKRGSVSLLQRRLAIGYTRASRLIDLMGIAGIISDHKGSVARDVLITMEEWEAMKGQAEADLAAIAAAGGGQQGQLFEGAAAPADGAAEEQTEEEELLEEYEEDEEEGPLDEADEEYEDEEYEEEDESEQERERAPF